MYVKHPKNHNFLTHHTLTNSHLLTSSPSLVFPTEPSVSETVRSISFGFKSFVVLTPTCVYFLYLSFYLLFIINVQNFVVPTIDPVKIHKIFPSRLTTLKNYHAGRSTEGGCDLRLKKTRIYMYLQCQRNSSSRRVLNTGPWIL